MQASVRCTAHPVVAVGCALCYLCASAVAANDTLAMRYTVHIAEMPPSAEKEIQTHTRGARALKLQLRIVLYAILNIQPYVCNICASYHLGALVRIPHKRRACTRFALREAARQLLLLCKANNCPKEKTTTTTCAR